MLLNYEVGIIGQGKIDQALAGIERRYVQHNRRLKQQARGGIGGRGGRRAAVTDEKQTDKDTARRIAAEKKVAAARDREFQRHITKEARETERAAKHRQTDLRKEQRLRSRAMRTEMRERSRLAKRAAVEQADLARETSRRRFAFARGTGNTMAGSVVGTGRSMLRYAGGAIALGGGFAAAGAVGMGLDLQERSQRLAIASRAAGGKETYSGEEIQKRVQRTAIATGMNERDIVGGLEQFVEKTGDIKTPIENLLTFAKVARATGAAVEDVASAAADMSTKFDINTVEGMQAAFAALTFQGKKGAFEIRNMASELPELGAAASAFGMKGPKGVRQLGALAQVARESTGSAPEASTAVQRMFDDLIQKSGGLRSGKTLGRKVETFREGDAKKGMRDPFELMADVIAATEGDVSKYHKVFGKYGAKAGNKLFTAGSESYQATVRGGGSRDEGMAAMRATVLKMLTDAMDPGGGAGWSEVQRDAQDAMQTTSAQLAVVRAKFNEAITTHMLPALTNLVPELEKLIPLVGKGAEMFGKLVSAFASNPLGSLIKIMTAKLVYDLAAAGIGAAVRGAITKQIAVAGAVPTEPGAGGSVFTGASGKPAPKTGRVGGAIRAMGGTSVAGATTAAITGLTVGTIVAGTISAKLLDTFSSAEESGKTFHEGFQVAMKSPTAAKMALPGLRQEYEKTKGESQISWKEIAGSLLGGPLGAIYMGYRTSQAEMAAPVAKGEKAALTRVEAMARGEGQEFRDNVASMAKAAAEATKVLQGVAASGGPNRSGSPTQPRVSSQM